MIEPLDVTVVVPAKDRADLLPRALASVARQTRAPREVVVIDDGSADDTADVARATGATVIRLETSGGSGPARNRGIEAARTTWIAFLDSDDEWDSDHLEQVMAHAGNHTLVTAPGRMAGRVVGNALERTLPLAPLSLLAPGAIVFTSGTVARREALVAGGLFRALPRAQDLDMWIRVLEQGSGIALADPTVEYHVHGGQVSLDRALMRACFDRIVADCAERPWFGAGDEDRAYTRWRWDELRGAVRGRDPAQTLVAVVWFLTHPHVWSTLVRLLQQRRAARRGSTRTPPEEPERHADKGF